MWGSRSAINKIGDSVSSASDASSQSCSALMMGTIVMVPRRRFAGGKRQTAHTQSACVVPENVASMLVETRKTSEQRAFTPTFLSKKTFHSSINYIELDK